MNNNFFYFSMDTMKITKNIVPQPILKTKDFINEQNAIKPKIEDGEKLLFGSLDCIAGVSKAQIGKHKIPRFLYHLTTQEAYELMLKDGCMKAAAKDDLLSHKALFMFDFVNFLKDWKSNPDWKNYDIRLSLIAQVSGDTSKDLALLRIPTRSLDNIQDLRIRSQNKLFSWGGYGACATDKAVAYLTMLMRNGDDYEVAIRKLLKIVAPKSYLHLTQGDLAKCSSLYKQRGEAIEYIYPQDIPINIVQKIGQAKIEDVDSVVLGDCFEQLLKDTPELNMLKLLD